MEKHVRPNLGRPRIKTADPELMRAINRFHVLDAIRRYGPISRVEIAARTELSRATISAITGALIEDALIDAKHVQLVNGGPRGVHVRVGTGNKIEDLENRRILHINTADETGADDPNSNTVH